MTDEVKYDKAAEAEVVTPETVESSGTDVPDMPGTPGMDEGLGCHSGACKSTRGTDYARYQGERLGAILEEVGLSRERIRFRTLAENMDADFAAYTREIEKVLLQMGPNPLKEMTRGEPVSASEKNTP